MGYGENLLDFCLGMVYVGMFCYVWGLLYVAVVCFVFVV